MLWWHLFMLRIVTEGEEGLGPWTSKGELTNGVIDLVMSSRRSDTKVCDAMDPKEHKWSHRFQGWQNDEWPQVCPTRVSSVGFSDNDTQSHDNAGLLGRADGSWSEIKGKVESVIKDILSDKGMAIFDHIMRSEDR
jgi:hypothetical protein